MKDRFNLTKKLVRQLKEPTKLETAMSTWWFNTRRNGGLRLTKFGFLTLTQDLDIKYYIWVFPSDTYLDQKLLLALDRNMRFPYYIEPKNKKDSGKLFMFGEKDMVFLSLCRDLKSFIERIKE